MKYRIIEKPELDLILKNHAEWLADKSNGQRADLRSADLRNADLSSADLSYADLRNADLRNADLSSADLSYADLSYADLRSADLSYADLRSADLRNANLSSADLLIFQFNRNTAYFTLDGTLRIGCICMPITEWVLGYVEIGTKEGYSPSEIKAYGKFINICLEVFESKTKA